MIVDDVAGLRRVLQGNRVIADEITHSLGSPP